MPKRYSSKETLRRLEFLGFVSVSQKGSHAKLKHADGRLTILPMGRKVLPPGTLNGVLDKAQISKLEFENAS